MKKIITALILVLALANCGTSAQQGLELLVTLENPVVDLDTDAKGNLYALAYNGDIVRIDSKKNSTVIYSGIKSGGFSWMQFAVLDDGTVVFNDYEDNIDVLYSLAPGGTATELCRFEDGMNVVTISSDKKSRIFAGFWGSDGNITVDFDPSRISAAENMWGKIVSFDIASPNDRREIFSGGVPISLEINPSGDLYASIWGHRGSYRAKNDSYSIVNFYHKFWVFLSKEVELMQFKGEQGTSLQKNTINALSNLAFKNNELVGFGLSPEDETAMLLIAGTGNTKITGLPSDKIEGTLAMKGGKNLLYFANVDGQIFRYVF
ncbi:MAG: hypothetical protein JW874_13610 [Spirochaetales bacterium]|nr:hypothetical protein [Spirochaetales bacterium]